MTGLYRGYYWAYAGGLLAGVLMANGGWWSLLPAIFVGVAAAFARVR